MKNQRVFSYATKWDYLAYLVGFFSSIAAGVVSFLPCAFTACASRFHLSNLLPSWVTITRLSP